MDRLLTMVMAGVLLATSIPTVAPASEENRGLALAREMDAAESGYGDYRVRVVMKLYTRSGKESVREMRFKTKEMVDDGDRSIVVFDRPRDLKGFAALTFSHKHGPDDQWLFLPSLHRVKRVATANQAGPFVGSEFAYEDIGSQEVEQYTYQYLGSDVLDGVACEKIARFPVNPNSGYSRQVVWIESKRKIPLRIDYFDRKDDLLKSLAYQGYRLYSERFWKPDRTEMVNHQVGRKTVIEYREYSFGTGLSERDLSVAALRRQR